MRRIDRKIMREFKAGKAVVQVAYEFHETAMYVERVLRTALNESDQKIKQLTPSPQSRQP